MDISGVPFCRECRTYRYPKNSQNGPKILKIGRKKCSQRMGFMEQNWKEYGTECLIFYCKAPEKIKEMPKKRAGKCDNNNKCDPPPSNYAKQWCDHKMLRKSEKKNRAKSCDRIDSTIGIYYSRELWPNQRPSFSIPAWLSKRSFSIGRLPTPAARWTSPRPLAGSSCSPEIKKKT